MVGGWRVCWKLKLRHGQSKVERGYGKIWKWKRWKLKTVNEWKEWKEWKRWKVLLALNYGYSTIRTTRRDKHEGPYRHLYVMIVTYGCDQSKFFLKSSYFTRRVINPEVSGPCCCAPHPQMSVGPILRHFVICMQVKAWKITAWSNLHQYLHQLKGAHFVPSNSFPASFLKN